jgi:hypothetical protein
LKVEGKNKVEGESYYDSDDYAGEVQAYSYRFSGSTFSPTLMPTPLQRLTTGWMYINYYFTNQTDADCPSMFPTLAPTPADRVLAARLGVCFPNVTYDSQDNVVPVTTFFMYSCSANQDYLQVDWFGESTCSQASFLNSYNIPLSSFEISYDDDFDGNSQSYDQCVKAYCTNQKALPISPTAPYSLNQQYEAYVPESTSSCYNAENFAATINKKCLAINENSSFWMDYPSVTEYGNANCIGKPVYSYAYPEGCFPAHSSSIEAASANVPLMVNHYHAKSLKSGSEMLQDFHKELTLRRKVANQPKQSKLDSIVSSQAYGDDYANEIQAFSYLYSGPITSGWLYINYYFTNEVSANCSAVLSHATKTESSHDLVRASRMGVCYANITYNDQNVAQVSNYYMYSCLPNQNSFQITNYQQSTCTGAILSTKVIPLIDGSTSNDPSGGSYAQCVQSFCTSDINLPISLTTPYSVFENYHTYLSGYSYGDANACYNAESMSADVNYKCLPINANSAYLFNFPTAGIYNNSKCSGEPDFIAEYPQGCFSMYGTPLSSSMLLNAKGVNIRSGREALQDLHVHNNMHQLHKNARNNGKAERRL